MYTTHQSPERIVSRELSYALVIGFPVYSTYTAPNQYDQVYLHTDGTVRPVAAVTDKPLGYIVSAYERTAGSKVRIMTGFTAIVRGECDGTLTPGDEVACSGIDASGTYDLTPICKYKTAVSTNYAIGRCLVGGLTTTCEALIGLYQRAYLVP